MPNPAILPFSTNTQALEQGLEEVTDKPQVLGSTSVLVDYSIYTRFLLSLTIEPAKSVTLAPYTLHATHPYSGPMILTPACPAWLIYLWTTSIYYAQSASSSGDAESAPVALCLHVVK